MYVHGGNKPMTLGLLRRSLWRARSIYFCFCAWLRDFPLRTFLLDIVNIYFQETNQLLFGFCFLGGVGVCLFLDSLSAGNIAAVGLFSRLEGRELLFLDLGSLFGWLLTLLLSFPSIFGSLGRWVVPCFVFWTVCRLFTQISFCEDEVFFWVLAFVCRICYISGIFCCCSASVILKFSLFLVASKWLLWLLASLAVAWQSDLQPESTLPFSLRLPIVQGEWGSVLLCSLGKSWSKSTFLLEEGGEWQ